MPVASTRAAWLDLGSGWLFEHIRDAVVVVDVESATVRLWNPAAAQLFGYAADEILGRSVDLILPDLADRAIWLDLISTAGRRAEMVTPAELRGIKRSDEGVVLEATPSLIDAPADGQQFVLLVLREASDRRLHAALATRRFLDAATSELARSLEYDTTLQTMARLAVPRLGEFCLVFGLDADLQIEHVALAHANLQQERELSQVLEGRPDSATPRLCQQMREVLQLGRAEVLPNIQHLWPRLVASEAGRATLAALNLQSAIVVPVVGSGQASAIMLMGSRASGLHEADELALAEDLARRCALALDNARLYRTAQQAIAARDQFLSIASHELRGPLARLKSHAEVLSLAHSHGQLDEDRLTWSIDRINASVDRLAALTKDVLDLSRLRGGQFPFRPSPLDLVELVADLHPRFTDQLGEHRLVLDLDTASCPVLVDEDRIEQTLINLLDNAAKYSPSGSDVHLSIRRRDDGILLRVSDEGMGLPPGTEEKIFEAFGRAPNAEHVSGMGLGLHICRLIVERHGGRIWADSAGENEGTTVSVWLPFDDASPLPSGDVQQRLSNQLSLALGYCELLASNPELPETARAQAVEALHGARDAAATLEDLQTLSR